eukprot:2342817-Pleurochrysis_carterae.AAC.1
MDVALLMYPQRINSTNERIEGVQYIRKSDATAASIARQRSVGDLLASSSFTAESAGRSRSVCHSAAGAPLLADARRSAARTVAASIVSSKRCVASDQSDGL